MGLTFPVGDLGQADRFGAHRGQMKFAGRGTDGGLRGGVRGRGLGGGAHEGLPVSRSS